MGKPPLTLVSYRPENWKSFDNVLNEMVTVVLETVEGDVWYGLWEGEGVGGASWEEEHL